jgi:two-component system sensor histidine kinase RpfC
MVRANSAPGTRRSIVIMDEEAVEDPAAAAAKLAALDPACAPSLLLLPREPQRGLPTPALRSRFVAVLAQPFAEAETLAALRLAGLRDAEDKDDAAPPASSKPGRKYAILVADDNRTNQKVIAKILERAGHEPTIVDNGERALDALTQHDFDLVLMDVNMPVLNGIEAVKLYRFAAIGKKRVPVVALTADATPEMSTRCTEAGMDACVTKPVEPARLLQIIDTMVEAAAPAAAAPAESETVKMLSSHPKFQAAGLAPVDFAKLTDLEALGGSGFVGQLIEEFLVDAETVLGEMTAAVAGNDVEAFRDRAHALRSGAANIGAGNIYKICLAWRNIGERELASDGEAHMRKLQTEFAKVHAALSRRLEGQRAEPSRQGA